jgi:hypothetical protein
MIPKVLTAKSRRKKCARREPLLPFGLSPEVFDTAAFEKETAAPTNLERYSTTRNVPLRSYDLLSARSVTWMDIV